MLKCFIVLSGVSSLKLAITVCAYALGPTFKVKRCIEVKIIFFQIFRFFEVKLGGLVLDSCYKQIYFKNSILIQNTKVLQYHFYEFYKVLGYILNEQKMTECCGFYFEILVLIFRLILYKKNCPEN